MPPNSALQPMPTRAFMYRGCYDLACGSARLSAEPLGGELGYDLHITRRDFWADDDGQAITLEEWLAHVAVDAEVEADPQNPGLQNYVIASHPDRWPLWWNRRRGEVYTKNPDDLVISKLVQIALALDARVLGDDDEIYGIDPSNPSLFERR